MARLVSFLGLGSRRENRPPYDYCRYELDGKISRSTMLVQDAILEVTSQPITRWTVLGTREVRERWIDTGELSRIRQHPRPEFEELPEGRDSAERWEIFERVRKTLSQTPDADSADRENGDVVLFDVTHGFRSHPILAMAAVQFALARQLQATRRAKLSDTNTPVHLPGPVQIRILYGAFEAKSGTGDWAITPIWDLTEFVQATAWHSALSALMRFGRADELLEIAKAEKSAQIRAARGRGEQGRDLRGHGTVEKLGELARNFADDLTTTRIPNVLTDSGPKLARWIEREEVGELARRLPPLRGILAELEEWLKPFADSPAVCSPAGLRALGHLARLYGALERFSEQSVTLREGLVLHWGLATREDPIPQPGSPGFDNWRIAVESTWNTERHRATMSRPNHGIDGIPTAQHANIEVARGFTDVRNDVQHGGFRAQPTKASTVRQRLDTTTHDLTNLPPPSVPARPREHRAILINLSNHPIDTWTPAQHAAAIEAIGEPTDLTNGMPLVDHTIDSRQISDLADDLVGQALAAGATAAAVFGEAVLSTLLVSKLQMRGIPCYAPAAARAVTAHRTAENEINRQSIFRFERWREYPRLG